jgi:mannan endo-1,4-beta-mannosidase
MTSVEDRIRAAIRAKVREIETGVPPPLRLPARRRRSVFLAYGGGEKDGAPLQRAWRRWLAAGTCGVLVGAIAVAAVTVAGSAHAPSSGNRPRAAHAVLRPGLAFYLGVYAAGAPPDYGPIAEFAETAGRQPDLVGYFSSWAQPFNATFATMLHDHGAVTLVQIDPAGASIAAIAAGDYDDYLRAYADAVRRFGHSVVIGFGHEMNARWYPWGYGHVAPAVFVAAWRHLVNLFRQQGADNVTWLWTIQAQGPGTGPATPWWPGSAYVTWVGIDGFYSRPSDTFPTLFGPTIATVRSLTTKPILLSQTAVSPQAGQAAKIRNLFGGVAAYGLLGLVWFNEAAPGNQPDWRIQDNRAAKAAFRRGVSTLTRR